MWLWVKFYDKPGEFYDSEIIEANNLEEYEEMEKEEANTYLKGYPKGHEVYTEVYELKAEKLAGYRFKKPEGIPYVRMEKLPEGYNIEE